ncbi:MAG: ABC transporter ATP-binding protein [Chloroflexota bacterium]
MKNTLLRSFLYLRPYWKLSAGAYLAMTAVQGFNLLMPQFIRWIIDQVIQPQSTNLTSVSAPVGLGSVGLAPAIAGLLLLTLVKGVLTYLEGQWSEIASQSVAYDLRNDIQKKLTQLSFSFHDTTETGELLSRSIQDVERIRFLTGRAMLRLLEGTLLLIGTGVMLFWMQPRLAALVTLSMPLLVFQALRFGRRYRPLSLQIQKQLAVLTTQVEQNLRGARVVKAFAQEEAEIERFESENRFWFNLSSLGARLQALNVPLLVLIANLGVVLIIWYGGSLVIQGQLSLGELVAFTTYLGQLVEPVQRLGMIIPALAIAASSGERIFEILDSVPDVKDEPGAPSLPPVQGNLRFEHVSFSYGRGQRRVSVLNNINFTAQPGQVVALLGPTGSGKSTIISLIPRFYDPTAGRILIDGHDIRQVAIHSLRTQVGIVMQETALFAASVRENIAFGRPGACEADVIAAARAAQAHKFILQMPDGYDTHVGERGVTLSGGQKQRLAIARALLMDPRILILDDATAAVDTETESLIQQAFERLMHGRTTFVIAHRLSTVHRADLILVLDKGQIVDRGAHASLLHTSPLYAEIYQRQLKPQSDSLPETPAQERQR